MNTVFYISKVYILHVCMKLGLYSYIICLRQGGTQAVFIIIIINIVCLRQGGGTSAVLSHANTGWIYTKFIMGH